MKTLYIECKMGVAGDMLTAALLELLSEKERTEAINLFNNLGLNGVKFSTEKVTKCGINGTHVSVLIDGQEEESHDAHHHHHEEHEHHHHEEHEHHHHEEHEHHHHDEHEHHEHHHEEHHHSHEEEHHHHHHHHEHHKLSDIVDILNTLNIEESVKNDVLNVYNIIAKAESNAHGVEVDQIHFHEVGNKDAIMDITAVCYLMNKIGAENIIASPIHVGSGQVHCAHGIMPVPAPATEFILRGIPYYQGLIWGELCTPTGAALLKYFAKEFTKQPAMLVEKTGIGCGKKDFEAANCVRVFMGEVQENLTDVVIELDANVDDMTPEEIGFAMNRLFDAGAREVFTNSVYMKKNRPGILITIICTEDKKDEIIKTLFKNTTTIGVRQKICDRYILKREIDTENTKFGPVRKKISTGYGTKTEKYEYDDLEKIAVENKMSLKEVIKAIEKE